MAVLSDPYILTLSCPDVIGIVAAVSGFLAERRCNIVDSAQFWEQTDNRFFLRISFQAPAGLGLGELERDFGATAGKFTMQWKIHDASRKPRLLLLVSKFGHCLNDLLYRYATGSLPVEIPAIISNHRDFYQLAAWHDIPFHHLPVTRDTKARQERRLTEIIEEERADLVVLARYMQVLSPGLCACLAGRAINIHHSFLSAGLCPRRQADRRHGALCNHRP
jgi:formyltetrahydrofolate deformylase